MSDAQAAGGAPQKGLLTKTLATRGVEEQQVDSAWKQIEETIKARPGEFVDANATKAIKAAKARLVAILDAQISKILHHPEFQKVEGTWRGLKHLVDRTYSSDEARVKVKVCHATKEELIEDFEDEETYDQSGMYKLVHDRGIGILGGEPVGTIVADYQISQSSQDMALVGRMAEVAAASWAPLLTAPSPKLFGLDDWTGITDPVDLANQLEGPEHIKWRAFREKEDSRFVGMVMPRVLMREPYSPENSGAKDTQFTEDVSGRDHGAYCWGNAAYSMAGNINQAMFEYGWPTRIAGMKSGGAVDGLPLHLFDSATGKTKQKCPAEVAFPTKREYELSRLGLIPLVHEENTDRAVFLSAYSAQKPKQYDDHARNASVMMASRLPYLMVASRFTHYLKRMLQGELSQMKTAKEVEDSINSWLSSYLLADPDSATQQAKAERPLAAASVKVKPKPGMPGHYELDMKIQPHFMIEDIDVNLMLSASASQQ